MTAAPASFSTVPPWVSLQRATPSKKLVTRRRVISGSWLDTNSVEETRSANRTVASLRSIPQVYGAGGPLQRRPSRAVCCALEAAPDRRAWHFREDLLLVIDEAALVGRDVGHVVGRREQAVDVAGGDRQTELIADEAAAGRARISRPGARILREPAEMLAGLLGIPRELGDPPVGADKRGAAAGVLVGL